jgi:PAS domain S-box-containing protein
LSWNRGAELLFGYSAAEMVGREISVLAPPELHHEIRMGREIAQVMQARSHESVRRTKDGRLIDVSIGAAPIKDAAGSNRAVALIFRDITERKQSLQAQAQHRTIPLSVGMRPPSACSDGAQKKRSANRSETCCPGRLQTCARGVSS